MFPFWIDSQIAFLAQALAVVTILMLSFAHASA